jgi:hypothetical protein
MSDSESESYLILGIGDRSNVLTIFGIYPKIHRVNVNSVSQSLGAGSVVIH